jgi:pSer/pThr/pTyr-binding forkhead associated (FHA) protein
MAAKRCALPNAMSSRSGAVMKAAYANGVSRMHAIIRHRAGSIVLIDLGSANGTYVNGRRLGSRQEAGLEDGDMIALGALKFQIRLKATKREGRKET